MKIRNNNPLDLEADDREVITVTISMIGSGTVFLVNHSLDGSGGPVTQGSNIVFTANKAKHDPSLLTLLFGFSNPSGGAYQTVITGSSGGDTSTFSVLQSFGIASDSITYTFDIL